MRDSIFFDAILETIKCLSPCYNGDVELVNIPSGNAGHPASARGVCPHCGLPSYFQPVGNPHVEPMRVCNPAQCQSCKDFVLIVCSRSAVNYVFGLAALYPLGKPNDSVDKAVPPPIKSDFAEALRCNWASAYKATVTMCRRALQASAIEKGAKGDRLIDQIDDLRAQGIITEPLKQMAHEIRLTGNDGAHPGKDGLADVVEKDADDIIEFTREYFHHVYVMPAKLAARRPAASAAVAQAERRQPGS